MVFQIRSQFVMADTALNEVRELPQRSHLCPFRMQFGVVVAEDFRTVDDLQTRARAKELLIADDDELEVIRLADIVALDIRTVVFVLSLNRLEPKALERTGINP